MVEFFEKLGIAVGVIAIISAIAILNGTIVWALWDDAIPFVFPVLVKDGYFAYDITWWQAVSLCWIIGALTQGQSKQTK